MINNNNNKEGQMTHRLQTQTFNFRGTNYKKGIDTYDFQGAWNIVSWCDKIQISFIDSKNMIQIEDVNIHTAYQKLQDSNRILVNKLGSALGCIIYLGAE